MHPAPSIIIFTVLSGFGFGLLFWLGLGYPAISGLNALPIYGLGFSSAVIGLVASTFHLGNPQRAWRAFTQWRTSWLSREGWLAVLALSILSLHALLVVFFNQQSKTLGLIGSGLALATVFATSMIYAQMRSVPRWNHWTTCALFLSLALSSGAILAIGSIISIALLIIAAAIQFFVWSQGDQRFSQRGSTIESATQLGHIGKVRQLEAPHTGSNYLLKEMAYQVGRKHAQKLRRIGFVLMFILPVIMLALANNSIALTLTLVIHIIGALVSRWLFFAEAEHVVGLYYGKHG